MIDSKGFTSKLGDCEVVVVDDLACGGAADEEGDVGEKSGADGGFDLVVVVLWFDVDVLRLDVDVLGLDSSGDEGAGSRGAGHCDGYICRVLEAEEAVLLSVEC